MLREPVDATNQRFDDARRLVRGVVLRKLVSRATSAQTASSDQDLPDKLTSTTVLGQNAPAAKPAPPAPAGT
jgi:hypothetical protein